MNFEGIKPPNIFFKSRLQTVAIGSLLSSSVVIAVMGLKALKEADSLMISINTLAVAEKNELKS